MDGELPDDTNRLSEIIHRALTEGPQHVQLGDDSVVILSTSDYARLLGERPSFKHYLTQGPSLGGLDLTRDHSPTRS